MKVSFSGFRQITKETREGIILALEKSFPEIGELVIALKMPKQGTNGRKGLNFVGYADNLGCIKANFQLEEKGPSVPLEIYVSLECFKFIKEKIGSMEEREKQEEKIDKKTEKSKKKDAAKLRGKRKMQPEPAEKPTTRPPKAPREVFDIIPYVSPTSSYSFLEEVVGAGGHVSEDSAMEIFRRLHRISPKRAQIRRVLERLGDSAYLSHQEGNMHVTEEGKKFFRMVKKTSELIMKKMK